MTHLTDRWVVPWLAILAEWSVRWGVVIAVLATWFVLRPPRRAATQYLLCLAVLAAGLLLPVTPRWGHAAIPGPSWGWLHAGGSTGSEPSPIRSHGAAAGPVVAPEAAHRRPSRVVPESVRQT